MANNPIGFHADVKNANVEKWVVKSPGQKITYTSTASKSKLLYEHECRIDRKGGQSMRTKRVFGAKTRAEVEEMFADFVAGKE